MKNITTIIIAFFFFSAANSQILVHNSIGFEYTPFTYHVCNELKIDKDIYIIPTRKHVQGYTQKTGFGGYVIFINNTINDVHTIRLILAHELQHISDDINGVWYLDTPTTKVFKGGHYRYVSKEAAQLERRVIASSYKLRNGFKIKR